MKDKKYLLYERSLLTCILMLFICIGLKLFGVPWFNLNTDVPILNEIDRIVMNSELLSFIYTFIFKFINAYLVCCICLKRTKINAVMLIPICVVSMLLARFSNNSVVTMLYDTFSLYLVCFKETRFTEYILIMGLNIVYQGISLFIRNLGYGVQTYDAFTYTILNLDYYIMLVLTYIVLEKGGYTVCGAVAHFGSFLLNQLSRMLSTASKRLSESRAGK